MTRHLSVVVLVVMVVVAMLMKIDDQTPSSGHQALNTIVAVK